MLFAKPEWYLRYVLFTTSDVRHILLLQYNEHNSPVPIASPHFRILDKRVFFPDFVAI